MAMLAKDPTFAGDNIAIPIIYEATNGASADFTTAQGNKDASSMVKFLIDVVPDYSLVGVSRDVMLRTRLDKGARLKAIEHAHEMALYSCGRSASHAIFRDGEGVLGRISTTSNVATTTITLEDKTDIVHFRKGMKLQASLTPGSALRSAGATVTVASVDRALGTVTATGNWTAGIAAVVAGDYVYRHGDARNNVAGAYKKMRGLLAWLPLTAPVAAENFFGVDRSVDRTRLAGYYTDKSALPFEEAVIEAQSEANVESVGIDLWVCNNAVKRLAQKALGSKVEFQKSVRKARDENGLMANIGFQTIQLEGDKGPIDLLADPDCPAIVPGDATKLISFFLRPESLTIYSMLDLPHIFDEGSAQMDLREATADAYEGRTGYYGQLAPTKDDAGPGDHCVALLPAA